MSEKPFIYLDTVVANSAMVNIAVYSSIDVTFRVFRRA